MKLNVYISCKDCESQGSTFALTLALPYFQSRQDHVGCISGGITNQVMRKVFTNFSVRFKCIHCKADKSQLMNFHYNGANGLVSTNSNQYSPLYKATMQWKRHGSIVLNTWTLVDLMDSVAPGLALLSIKPECLIEGPLRPPTHMTRRGTLKAMSWCLTVTNSRSCCNKPEPAVTKPGWPACCVKWNYRVLMCANYLCTGNIRWQLTTPEPGLELQMSQLRSAGRSSRKDIFGGFSHSPKENHQNDNWE